MKKVYSTVAAFLWALASCQPVPAFADDFRQPFIDAGPRPFFEQLANPPTQANTGWLFTKDVTGATELFYLDEAGNATQLTGLAASGDVVGPASSTDNAVALWNSTTGKLLKNSTVIVNPTTGKITTNGPISWSSGTALTGAEWMCTRNAGTPNDISCNVPTGSMFNICHNGACGYVFDASNLGMNGRNLSSVGYISTFGKFTWSLGIATTAANYEDFRDADGTNNRAFNVPTGAGYKFYVNGVGEIVADATSFRPATNDGNALGVASTGAWSDLFLAGGGVINWGGGDVTITHSNNNELTFDGASIGYVFNNGPIVANGGINLQGQQIEGVGAILLGSGGTLDFDGFTIQEDGAGAMNFSGVTHFLSSITAGGIDMEGNDISNASNVQSSGFQVDGNITIGASGGAPISAHYSNAVSNVTSSSIAAGTCGVYGIISVIGAVHGDTVVATPDEGSSATGIEDVNLMWNAYVANVGDAVIIRACNPQAVGAVNAGDDQEWRADVWKH